MQVLDIALYRYMWYMWFLEFWWAVIWHRRASPIKRLPANVAFKAVNKKVQTFFCYYCRTLCTWSSYFFFMNSQNYFNLYESRGDHRCLPPDTRYAHGWSAERAGSSWLAQITQLRGGICVFSVTRRSRSDSVTEWVSHSKNRVDWCDPGKWRYLLKTLLRDSDN